MDLQEDAMRKGMAEADIIITTGGTSMGEADLLKVYPFIIIKNCTDSARSAIDRASSWRYYPLWQSSNEARKT